MFFSYPDGWPGAGLVLLRAAGGAFLTVQGLAYMLDSSNHQFLTWVFGLLALGSGVLLLIGCITRAAAVLAAIACGGSLFSLLPAPHFEMLTRLPALLVIVIAAAVICLGPGAFSLDARRFGRREVVIPKDPDSQR